MEIWEENRLDRSSHTAKVRGIAGGHTKLQLVATPLYTQEQTSSANRHLGDWSTLKHTPA